VQHAINPLGICSVIYANCVKHIPLMNAAFGLWLYFQVVLDGIYLSM